MILLAALSYFREPIISLIPKMTKIKVGPLEGTIVPSQPEGPKGSTESSATYSVPMSAIYSPPFHEYVNLAESMFEQSLPTYLARFGGNREEAVKRAAIDFFAALPLERASRFIYGSQIDAERTRSKGISSTSVFFCDRRISGDLCKLFF